MPTYQNSRRTPASTTGANALDLPVPRSTTALMQHLQTIVGREHHHYWCGGVITPEKFPAFLAKMARRYPITRTTRQRSYDRKLGRAAVHFVALPLGTSIAWWLLSDAGSAGLADPASPDTHVSGDAMRADSHIEFADYVLLYATKREARAVKDRATGHPKTIFKNTSTWTWKLQSNIVSQLRAAIDECCAELRYGDEGGSGRTPWGLRGLLAAQRKRPQFSGVRNQIIELHRYARDGWKPQRQKWLGMHTTLAQRYGEAAGALRPINRVIAEHLPKMVRIKVYADPPQTLRSLCVTTESARSQDHSTQ